MSDTETMPNGIAFSVSSVLVKRAPDIANRSAEWKENADQWRVTISCAATGRNMEIDYRTGTAHRRRNIGTPSRPVWSKSGPVIGRFVTLAQEEELRAFQPVPPSAKDILICIGSDVQTAEEMPRDDAAAMDYLQDEFGHEGKGSVLLRMVRALRETHDKVRDILRGAVTVADFCDWCRELDS